jgi:hypothetical protein
MFEFEQSGDGTDVDVSMDDDETSVAGTASLKMATPPSPKLKEKSPPAPRQANPM